jgi:hypothetical protein
MAALGAHADDGNGPRNHRLKDAVPLLQEALAIIDSTKLAPHVGARLQEVIEALDRELR